MNINGSGVRGMRGAKSLMGSCALAVLVLIALYRDTCVAGSTVDHLVPLQKQQGLGMEYEKLWQQKLLVSSGDVAQFVGLPGNVGEETAVTVFRRTEESNSPGSYWVTATQAVKPLRDAIAQPGGNATVDPQSIGVERCDAPLPDRTALAIHRVWITMLSQTRPEPKSESISLDSSTEIFSAIDADGKLLQGQSSTKPGKNSLALAELALSLMEYCDTSSSQREDKAREIEKAASELLKELTTNTHRETSPNRNRK